jgi:hypothetical protein
MRESERNKQCGRSKSKWVDNIEMCFNKMEQMGEACGTHGSERNSVLVRESEINKQCGRSKIKWVDNIEMVL